MLSIDILIVSKNRPELLEKCLLSIQRAAKKSFDIHASILLGISGEFSPPQDLEIPIQKKFFSVDFSPPLKRNSLLMDSKADWIFFCDDDVVVPENLFVDFQYLTFEYPGVSVFGGPNLTPPNSSLSELAQGKFLGSLFTNPLFYPRYAPRRDRKTQSSRFFCLCNLFVRKLPDILFSHTEFCGEELQLLKDLDRQGLRFFYSKDLWVYHHRRKSENSFRQQIFSYGRGRGIYLRKNLPRFASSIAEFGLKVVPKKLGLFGAYCSGIKEGLSTKTQAPVAFASQLDKQSIGLIHKEEPLDITS
jgi:glycosyltransferase involved in cell wall biosynthesis